VLDAPVSNTHSFVEHIAMFYQLTYIGLFGTNEPFSNLKTLICRMYSYQKLTQFSQGNNVLNSDTSNRDVFLWISINVPSTQLNSPTWNKQSLTLPWKTEGTGSIPVKN
jgi:hypothetical protein